MINIVFLGDQKAGQTIAEHRTLFDNKITIVSAETGQVIPLSSKQLKFEQQLWSFSTGAKVFLTLAVFTAILVATLITMYKQDVFNFATALNESTSEEIKIESVYVIEIETDKVIQQEQGVKTVTEQANSADILQALVAGEVIVEVKPEPEKASPIDIITAIAKLDSSEKQTFEKPSTSSLTQENVDEMDIKQQPVEAIASVKELTKTDSSEELVNKINSNYYLSQQTGFVIQFAGFREEKGYQDFITQNQTIEHMAYYRMLADNPFITVTSIVYPTRIEAQQQMDKFAQQMPDRGLWVKSLNVIKDEINTFQSSQ